jgi:CheY-like chemotaxis protein
MSDEMNASGRAPPRVLLVDGHADTLHLMQRALREENYDVIPAGGFDEGLRLGLIGAPDVLVCELRLPDGSGWHLLERLRESHPYVVGIAATGLGMPRDVARSEEVGYCVHLTKPINLAALRDAVAQCLAQHPEPH